MRLIHTSSTKPRNHYPTHTVPPFIGIMLYCLNKLTCIYLIILYFLDYNILCYNIYSRRNNVDVYQK